MCSLFKTCYKNFSNYCRRRKIILKDTVVKFISENIGFIISFWIHITEQIKKMFISACGSYDGLIVPNVSPGVSP